MSAAASERTGRVRRGLPILLGLHLLGSHWLGSNGTATAAEQPPLSRSIVTLPDPVAAPTLRFEDLDGQIHDLSDLRGRPVIVNFWASWCPPCRREMPSLERLYRQMRERGLEVLAVNVGEDFDTVFPFTGQLDPAPSFPLLLDPDASSLEAWRVKGLPTSFLIDTQGRVVGRAVGGTELDGPAILERLGPYLRDQAQPDTQADVR